VGERITTLHTPDLLQQLPPTSLYIHGSRKCISSELLHARSLTHIRIPELFK